MSSELPDPTGAKDSQETPLLGRVVAIQANFYQVSLDWARLNLDNWGSSIPAPLTQLPNGLLCTCRSRLKKVGQRVMVGDQVAIEEPDWEGGRGAISQVYPRRSELDRPPVANADQILLVFALAEPNLDPHQLSRFLVKAESTGLTVCLCLSKRDLATTEKQVQWGDRLQHWGYTPIFMSLREPLSMEALKHYLDQKITIVSGPSGVGKSSLINRLVPQAELRVGAVSGKLGRGRHTTRHVELFELTTGGLLADTPGFNQPDLDCMPQDLASFFPEARQRLEVGTCQFADCLHREEPNCVVRGDWERYAHYLDFLETAITYQQTLERLGDEEAIMKLKTKRQGRQQYEPKLETKKYRRPSRRTQHQTFQTLRDLEEKMMEDDQ